MMANMPTIPLPKGFAGKLLSPGNCLDCGDYATLYLFLGTMEGERIPEPGLPLLVHQGKACGGFRKRFAIPEGDANESTAACDEQGTFVGVVPGVVARDLIEPTRVLPPGGVSNPMRRRNTDEG